MSTRNVRASALLKLGASVVALVAVVAVFFLINRGGDDDPEEEFYGYFLRDAKTLQDMGLPVYWLGREFTATPKGIVFRGPYGVGFGAEVEGGGVFMRYLPEGSDPGLELTDYSADAWNLVRDTMLNPRPLPSEGEVARQTVTVNGHDAELIFVPQTGRKIGQLRLVLDLDEVVVVALVRSGGPGSAGVDYSLFIRNPDLLVQVMQDLRPYPE